MEYPMSYPFANFFKFLGFTLIARIDVFFDEEAQVYVATSQDVEGLVLEATTFDALSLEVCEAIKTLKELNNRHYTSADLIFKKHLALA